MSKTQTHLEVFIASPMDVDAERKVMKDVIDEFNQISHYNIHLDLLMYETDTYPAIGSDPQDVINSQIGDSYDIFIGIMWGRFGSPTPRASSGTEEEFNRAVSRRKVSSENIQVMFYFKEEGISPSDIDIEQFTKVQKFKTSISKEQGVLYYPFDNTDDFRNKVRLHLNKVVKDWIQQNESKLVLNIDKDEISPNLNNPLSNIAALENNDYEEDIIDLSEEVVELLNDVTNIILRINNATENLGNSFNKRTKEVEEINSSANKHDALKLLKKSSNGAASDFESYVSSLITEIPKFSEKHQLVMDTFGNIAMMASNDLYIDSEHTEELKKVIIIYKETFEHAVNGLKEFHVGIDKFPRMTSNFNRAKRRAMAILDDFLEQLRIAENQTKDVIKLLEQKQ